jgi:hypothetical protein
MAAFNFDSIATCSACVVFICRTGADGRKTPVIWDRGVTVEDQSPSDDDGADEVGDAVICEHGTSMPSIMKGPKVGFLAQSRRLVSAIAAGVGVTIACCASIWA